MEKIISSFSLSFLLRCFFCGVFFVISLATAIHGMTKPPIEITAENLLKMGSAISLIAGVSIYGIHRSLIYPLFEVFFNSDIAQALRRNWIPLITRNSIKKLKAKWNEKIGKDETEKIQQAKHLAVWADYIHLQFASCWCIAFATFAGQILYDVPILAHPPLLALGGLFFSAAIISNWRIHSVEQLLDEEHTERLDGPISSVGKSFSISALVSLVFLGGWFFCFQQLATHDSERYAFILLGSFAFVVLLPLLIAMQLFKKHKWQAACGSLSMTTIFISVIIAGVAMHHCVTIGAAAP